MDKLPMTLRGFTMIEDELKRLKGEGRSSVIKAIAEA
ncbi:MAG TPA: transcription elongation factor GreA, partial [Alphaproteobacteria bacterium]|nr:transcription elongation factor GreA [Alphaproteobacteria bacterium]